jgi:hypothetical protein
LFVHAKDLFFEATDQQQGSLSADQQNKSSDSYQQGKQSTDGNEITPMPTRLDLFRPSAFLRRSDTQPEEKIAHRPMPSLFLI